MGQRFEIGALPPKLCGSCSERWVLLRLQPASPRPGILHHRAVCEVGGPATIFFRSGGRKPLACAPHLKRGRRGSVLSKNFRSSKIEVGPLPIKSAQLWWKAWRMVT